MVSYSRAELIVVIIDHVELDKFRGWEGPIGRSVDRLLHRTKDTQVALVGKRSGKLAASIDIHHKGYGSRGIEATVGAGGGNMAGRRGYALYTDQGTAPHMIKPRDPHGYLIFYWAKVGRVVHLKSVQHPGNKAYRWAERGLEIAMASWQVSG